MADGVFHVSVLTPEAQLLDTEARAVVLRSSDGDLTVLDGHTPLITDVVPGLVRVDPAEGEPVRLAVHGGYMHVETGLGLDDSDGRSTRVTVLAGIAELADQIDVARAEQAKAETESHLEELRAAGRTGERSGTGGDGETGAQEDLEVTETEARLRRAEVRLDVAGASASA